MTKMDKSIQKTLIIVGGIILLAIIGIIAYSSFSPTNTVTGNGEATIKVIPDEVSVYFNIETKGTTSQEASDKNSGIVNNLTIALLQKGFNQNQIQTISFNIYPNYNYNSGQHTQNGYIASHSIRIEMPTSDSSKIGNVIDAGVSAGAGISYINFELSQEKQNEYKAQALKEATEDSKIKAQAIASGLGKNLGRLVSITDNSFGYYPWPIYRSADGGVAVSGAEAKSAAANITPSEQEVSASVTALYKLA